MCGIFGIFGPARIDSDMARRVAKILKHRGPDDEGHVLIANDGIASCFSGDDTPSEVIENLSLNHISQIDTLIPASDEASVYLGHRRLSIRDLSAGGHQPMSDHKGLWIVFNGEIYNYKALKGELEACGCEFSTSSDTELILASYKTWGVDCLSKFNGMWSFVIYDLNSKEIFIARDRFGVKPFYYAINNNSFYFASEEKALIAFGIPNKVDPVWIEDYLKNGHDASSCNTPFKNIKRLEAGHYIKCKIDNINQVTQYIKKWWDITDLVKLDCFKVKGDVELFRNELISAVHTRIDADVNVGIALSGGLDSSAIASITKLNSNDSIAAYSTVYTSRETSYCDESTYIKSVCNFLRLNNHSVDPGLFSNIPEVLESIAYHQDEPMDSSGMGGFATYQMMRQKGCKISIDGQGADEVLMGYRPYYLYWLSIKDGSALMNKLYSLAQILGLRRTLFIAIGSLLIRFEFGRNLLVRFTGNPIFKHKCVLDARIFDIKRNLPSLLHNGDRQSMANSIESRFPFLDINFVTNVFRLPFSDLISCSGWSKYILRKAFVNELPKDVVWRRIKFGWPSPEEYWYESCYKNWADLKQNTAIEFLKRNQIKYKLPIKKVLRRNRLVSLGMWCERFSV